MQWRKVALIGVGLLGGSMGMALKERLLARTVVGFVRRRKSLAECKEMGAVDRVTLDLAETVSGADLVVLCTPLAQMRGLVERMLPHLEAKALVTDVGSVKGSVVREMEAMIAKNGQHFIGSHPMAGAERTGVRAGRSDLFENAITIVTPTAKTSKSALRQIEGFWKSLGSKVIRMSPEVHDGLVSRSSHLPHVIAAVLAHSVLSPGTPKEQSQLCSNGFRDTTRIASGSPEMWRDIAIANRNNLAAAVQCFVKELRAFQRLLKTRNELAISKFFEEAKERRDNWRGNLISPSPE